MARITVEDCVVRVPNRFDLVMLASQRARDVSAGAPLAVERDNDKNPVVALREIADDKVDLDHLRYELIHGLRRHVAIEDRPDDDLMMAFQDQPMVDPEADEAVDLDEPAEDEPVEEAPAEETPAEETSLEDDQEVAIGEVEAEPVDGDPDETL